MKAEEVMRDAINIKCACLRGGENYTDDLEGEYVKETQLKLAAEIKNQTNLSLANSIH